MINLKDRIPGVMKQQVTSHHSIFTQHPNVVCFCHLSFDLKVFGHFI